MQGRPDCTLTLRWPPAGAAPCGLHSPLIIFKTILCLPPLQSGNALFAAGSYQEALEAYSQALELGGQDAALLRCGS